MHQSARTCCYRSPLGELTLLLSGDRCLRVGLRKEDAPFCAPDHPVAIWLRGYFAGKQLPLPRLASPATDFQARLRQALLDIPRGEVRTYGQLAKQLDSSPRAVGQALAANPLPIVVPCHRVVSAHGLGGFSGGTDWKEKLLKFEQAI